MAAGFSPDAGRRGLAALFFATVTVFADLYITQPILPLLSHEFGVPAPTAAFTLSVVVLMIALVSNAWGPLGDTFGRKPVMVWSCALLAVPTLLCAAAPTLSTLVFLRALQGILLPGVTAIAVAYLGDQFAGSKLGPFLIAAGAATLSLVRSLPVVIASLVVLCVGMFFVQGTAPAFVNTAAREAKGGAGALYTTFYYLGATFGSVLPGYAWQAFGWPGVVAACLAAFAVGLLADLTLCA